MTAKIINLSLHAEVAERLRDRILRHQLKPGDWIDEVALAAEFGISRTPLREALKVLAGEGLVTLVPRRGCHVSELSDQDLSELFPVVAMLEGRCAAAAATKLSEEQLELLEALHARLNRHAKAGDTARYYEVNYEFHDALRSFAGNRWLHTATADLRRVLRLSRYQQLAVDGRLAGSMQEHEELMQALRERRAPDAERVMHDHVMAQLEALRTLSPALRATDNTEHDDGSRIRPQSA